MGTSVDGRMDDATGGWKAGERPERGGGEGDDATRRGEGEGGGGGGGGGRARRTRMASIAPVARSVVSMTAV